MQNISMKRVVIAIIFFGVATIQLDAKGWDPTSADSWKKVGGVFDAPKEGANGFICDSNSDCDSHACVASRCHSKLKKGDDCSNDGQCKNGLYCSGHAGNMFSAKCASQKANGADCQSDSACKSGKCEGHTSGSGDYGTCAAK